MMDFDLAYLESQGLVIEKNVSLFEPHGRPKKIDALFTAIQKMNIGDSLTIPFTTAMRQRAVNDGRFLGFKMKTRRLRDGRHLRVWRIA
jgi:hypothetical protein